MKRILCMGLAAWVCAAATVRSGYPHGIEGAVETAGWIAAAETGGVSGQGGLTFRVLHTRDILPEAAQAVLEKAHGGFAVDRRDGHGEVYFALPGAGIIRLGSDLSSAELLPTDEAMKGLNMHNTTIWYTSGGEPRLVFPANGDGKVFTTNLNGELLGVLEAPGPDADFDNPPVDEYFANGGGFAPTDVEYMHHLYYITTGYSPLDYVLTAEVGGPPFSAKWHDFAFGGKGTEPGQFQTGHGITVAPGGKRIDIADRPVAEIDRYTRYGQYRETIKLPEGAFPCDIDYEGDLALVPCLHGKDREKGAPAYILRDGEVVSTIMPKHELGLERFQHIHNGVIVNRNGRWYVILQAWNPGDFVVLEQVAG